MEKRGDFREGESRSDVDMTKIATHTDGYLVGTKKELEGYKATHPGAIKEIKEDNKDQ
jgi:hypothetical protein